MNIFGKPSEDPARYWNPFLGVMNISVDAVGLLTPDQMYSAYMMAKAMYGKGS